MRSLVTLLAAPLAALALDCAAAPTSVPLGDTRIALDAPAGFSDTTFTGSPRLQELAETMTSASNRILMFAISDADLRKFTVGDQPDFRRYMLVVTPKGMERERITQASFQRYVADSLRDMGAAAEGDFARHMDKQPAGSLSLLAELRREPAMVSVLQGMRLPPTRPDNIFSREKPQYLLSTTTLLLVRGKAISLAVYTIYDAPTDLEWIRGATLRWVEDLQKLNGAR